MSLILKFKQTKDDVWYYDFELADLGVTAIRHEDVWNGIMLNVTNDRDSYDALCKGDRQAVKKAIEKCMLEYLESHKEELYEDLNHFVKIYPLIKKGK